MIKTFILSLFVLCLMVQSLPANTRSVKNLYPGHIAWEIKPGGEWEEREIKEDPSNRKMDLYGLYEKISEEEASLPKKPSDTRDIYGLNISRYYLGWDQDHQNWVIFDMMSHVYSVIKIFYSPDPVYSRQKAFEEMLINMGSYPTNGNRNYKWTTSGEGVKTAFLEKRNVYDSREKLVRDFFAEKGGYSLLITDYWRSPNNLMDKEVFQICETILSALNGDSQFGYFPKRTRQLDKKRKERESMPYEQRSRLDDQLREYTRGMPKDMPENICKDNIWSSDEKKFLELLGLKEPDKKGEDCWEMIPNVNSGIGALKWIRKWMKIPFTLGKGYDDSHVNGLEGTFQLNENGRDYPVRYTIMHLHTRGEAMRAMFGLQASNQWGLLFKQEILEKILQPYPKLVGDCDICLKPIINELGQPIPNGEHSWISFIRGNTVVMLKNEEMEVSVLPLAKKIDEELRKNMELFIKPEEVR